MALVWQDDKYATGFPEVDDQHREIFDKRGNCPQLVSEVEDKVCGWLHRHLLAIDLVLRRFAS